MSQSATSTLGNTTIKPLLMLIVFGEVQLFLDYYHAANDEDGRSEPDNGPEGNNDCVGNGSMELSTNWQQYLL